jgi:DNA-binding NarL/FixJ family response regulator
VGDVEEFIDAVERVAAGGTALDPEVVGRMLGRRRTEAPWNCSHRGSETCSA